MLELSREGAVALSGNGQNGRSITNFKTIVVADIVPFPKPFHVQFIQMNVVKVVEVK